MSYNYTLKYRTFDQLLDDVRVDFKNYTLSDLIEPQELIKVVKRVNYDLGLRIFSTKETLIEIDNHKARLPNDFFVLNFAMLCDQYTVSTPVNQGTHMEERKVDPVYQNPYPKEVEFCKDPVVNQPSVPCTCHDTHSKCKCHNTTPRTFLNCKGETYELVQVLQVETRTYKTLMPLRIARNAQSVHCDCPNLYMNAEHYAWIRNGWLEANFEHSKCYINYQGIMEDDQGNLLCPDHDGINDYYEYALKERILENLAMNDETNVAPKLQLIQGKLRAARNYALTIVNTPNFQEMQELHNANRKAQYSRYYDMFKSFAPSVGNQMYFNDFGNLAQTR